MILTLTYTKRQSKTEYFITVNIRAPPDIAVHGFSIQITILGGYIKKA